MLPTTDPLWNLPEGVWTPEQSREAMRRVALASAQAWAQRAWLLVLSAATDAPEHERKQWANAAFISYAKGLDPVVDKIARRLAMDAQETDRFSEDMAIVFRHHYCALAANTASTVGTA